MVSSAVLSPANVEQTDPFFVEISILGLQKVINSGTNIIIIVKMVTTEFLLHLGVEIIV